MSWDKVGQLGGSGGSVHVGDTPPATPSPGGMWFNSADGSLSVYYADTDSSQWVATSGPAGMAGPPGEPGGTVFISPTPPPAPKAGDLWFNSDDGSLLTYFTDADSSQWVSTSGAAGPRGPKGDQGIQGTQGIQGPKGDKGDSGELIGTVTVAQGGTGATTVAAARANLGLKSAAQADILGTVSQSSGVPTGAIVQRGSNSNGSFVRFADGTQICWLSFSPGAPTTAIGSLFRSASRTWNYPIAFSEAPSVSGLVPAATGAYTWVAAGDVYTSTTSCSFVVMSAVSIATSLSVSVMAVGRWF